jgi:hypothetical protein
MFDPARHSALTPIVWDPETARRAIAEIVTEAEARFDAESYWPGHPQEDEPPDRNTGFYFGAGGVLWAMDFLKREGVADHGLDLAALLPRLLEANRGEFATMAPQAQIELRRPSYLFGDVPILLMSIQAGIAGAADDLFGRLRDNLDLPVLELMWGFAGNMLACVFAAELTGEDRWRELYLAQARSLLDELEDTEAGPIWTQQLYGRSLKFLGPVHGYAGNMLALLRGWDWLAEADRSRIRRAVFATLAATAQRGEMGVNWPPAVSPDPAPALIQHCHGAPGMINALADRRIATAELIGLLEGGGELTWRAGPLAKGSNLCHGTGGNGYAFLKLHQLTGEATWLDRAQAFAMHAIEQCRAARTEHGRGRYSLWTGDVGLACYLHECLRGSARFPTADVF